MLDTISQDLKYSTRSLGRSPGFALIAVSSLAVCIAAGTLIFGTVSLLLGASKPVERIDQLVDVFTNVRDAPFQTSSYPDYLDLRARNSVLQDVVASGPVIAALNPGGGTRMIIGESVSGNYFQTLGLRVALGRPILPADDQPAAFSSSRICAWMVTSSAVVGSSAIRMSGSLASAMAIITRCRWPPESSCG